MPDFLYSGQIRSYLTQCVRAMSGFQVSTNKNSEGKSALITVPVIGGNQSREVATIIQQNSENTQISLPLMSLYINSFDYDRANAQIPQIADKVRIQERKHDGQKYLNAPGDFFIVHRPMPFPVKLGLTLDIATSNMEQKLQLLEQILIYFNPSIEIQSNSNFFDQTSITTLELNEGITWSSRSIPIGTDASLIDICSLTFEMKCWISPPVSITRNGVIERVVTSIYDNATQSKNVGFNVGDLLSRQYISILDYHIILLDNEIRAYEIITHDEDDVSVDENSAVSWPVVIEPYGELSENSKIIMEMDSGNVITGMVNINSDDDTILNFTIDKNVIPSDNPDYSPVDMIINPLNKSPGFGLPAADIGQKYLILADMATNRDDSWGHSIAKRNDIIEYKNGHWEIIFDASTINDITYITSLSGKQYKWTGDEWVKSYEGLYRSGKWSIQI